MLELSANMPVAVVGEASPLGFASFCGGNPDVAPIGNEGHPDSELPRPQQANSTMRIEP